MIPKYPNSQQLILQKIFQFSTNLWLFFQLLFSALLDISLQFSNFKVNLLILVFSYSSMTISLLNITTATLGEVGLKVDKFDIGRFICDLMTSKVIKCQCNMLILMPELLVEILDLFFKKFHSHPCCFVVSITKTVPGYLYLFETSGLLRFPNVKDRPFLSASLVANKCDGNSDFLPYICCDAILQSGGALWQVSFMNLSHDSMSLQSKEPWFIHVQVIFSGYFSSLLATLSLPLQDWLTLPLHVSSTPWGCIWSNCEFIWWFFGNILYSCL